MPAILPASPLVYFRSQISSTLIGHGALNAAQSFVNAGPHRYNMHRGRDFGTGGNNYGYSGRDGDEKSSRGHRRGGRHGRRGRQDYGEQSGRGGRGGGYSRGPPAGLRGKEIGLYFAARGKKKRQELEKRERPVVTINTTHQRNIESVLADRGSAESVVVESANIKDEKETASSCQPTASKHTWRPTCLTRCPEIDRTLMDASCSTEDKGYEYQKMQEFRRKLPSYKSRQEVIDYVNKNQVILISGETGCGKTTQVPQFLLDNAIESGNGSICHVICTQPRRLSATSVAERVAAERGEKCGEASCGYQIRLESALPRQQGSILYCTTGVLLRRLLEDPLLKCASHIILDEVHERDLLSDFMLIIAKDLLPQRPDLKLILMSATLNAEIFSMYFDNCPKLHIPGYTFPVKEFYLEDVVELTRYTPANTNESKFPHRKLYGKRGREMKEAEEKKEIEMRAIVSELEYGYHPNTIDTVCRLSFEETDFIFITELIRHICLNREVGAILVFLPGWDAISKLHEALTKSRFFSDSKFIIIPLHSMMPSANQRQVFDRPPPGVWKIIIATNIAETSITIDDVVYVIDSGQCKEKGYDPELHMTCLNNVTISKASAKQRSGRAGRVQPGICFHLFTKYRHTCMEDFQLPEMLRTPLEDLCLQVKILELGAIEDFLVKAIQPPDRESVRNSIASLQQLNALDAKENLTPLGRHLASLPIDANIGKMILFGAIFSCLDPILTIASSLGFKSPFVTPLNKEKEVDSVKRNIAGDSLSDHILLFNAYRSWERAKRFGDEKDYCWDNFLSAGTLNMIKNMKTQFAQLLYDIGFIQTRSPSDRHANSQSGNEKLVKAVLCAGLYPNVIQVHHSPSPKRPPKLYTLQGKVSIHPASVNAEVAKFKTKWLIYHKKMKTTMVFVYDTTMVSPFSLLFFGGQVTTGEEEGSEIIKVDNWVKFHASAQIADLVEKLKRKLDTILDKKAKYPKMDLTAPENGPVLQAIVDLITTEEIYTQESSR